MTSPSLTVPSAPNGGCHASHASAPDHGDHICTVALGLGLLAVAEATQSMTLLLAGVVAAGIVLALTYRASLQIINEIAPQAQRAEVVASFQVVHFIANSSPVIGVRLLALLVSTPIAHRVFALVPVMLALIA